MDISKEFFVKFQLSKFIKAVDENIIQLNFTVFANGNEVVAVVYSENSKIVDVTGLNFSKTAIAVINAVSQEGNDGK